MPLLGRIPLVPRLREGGDVGRPVVAESPGSEAATAVEAVAERLLAQRRRRPDLPLINVT
ncbi:hypothetical protein BH20ACT9_BH20ACT9_13460 [soil metagenome]